MREKLYGDVSKEEARRVLAEVYDNLNAVVTTIHGDTTKLWYVADVMRHIEEANRVGFYPGPFDHDLVTWHNGALRWFCVPTPLAPEPGEAGR